MSDRKLPFVSIIVPVYGMSETIEKCVESLLNLNYSDYEIIIVNDKTPDNSSEIVSRVLSKYPVEVINRPERKGISSARNDGVKASKGIIIAFTDADCTVDRNWLRELVKNYEIHKEKAGGVGGIIKTPPKAKLFEKCVGTLDMPNPAYLSGNLAMSIAGANSSYPRKTIERIGGWDEEIIWGGDDVDFNFKVRKEGLSLVVEPKAIVYHHHRQDPIGFLKWRMKSGESTFHTFLKYPKMYSRVKSSIEKSSKFILGTGIFTGLAFFASILVWLLSKLMSCFNTTVHNERVVRILALPIIYLSYFAGFFGLHIAYRRFSSKKTIKRKSEKEQE